MNQNPLRKKIGIIGGGQLGRMMIEETLRYNFTINTLDAAGSPCEGLSAKHITGSLKDAAAIRQLAQYSDVLTYEIEHINIDVLFELEKAGMEIIPSPRILQIIQDKGLQKQFFEQHQIPTGSFKLVETEADWLNAIDELGGEKLVAKTRKEGYDGKGVAIFHTAELKQDIGKRAFMENALIEVFVPCQTELSVMIARDKDGNSKTWPVVDMEFDPIANLVTYLNCPAQVSDVITKQAQEIALRTIAALDGVGVFAVELLLGVDGNIYVNEVAPRPHNSGHHTIEACYTSQFEQLVRICAGLPLGSTELIQPAVMMNLLGGKDFSGPYRLQGLEEASGIGGVYIHLYGKTESKPMRKMGHVTITADTLEEAKNKAKRVHELLIFVADN
ncbi:MAG: 5-(carboxyamino)imidazole ribonucleotide synthase [Bacteroidota bacterium]